MVELLGDGVGVALGAGLVLGLVLGPGLAVPVPAVAPFVPLGPGAAAG